MTSSWTRHGDGIRLEVNIPVGSAAEIHLPGLGCSSVVVTESGKPVWTGATQADRTVVVETGPGRNVLEVQ